MKKEPISFIHIPKTAGTSFRRAAEKYFPEKSIIRNYGPKSPETQEGIRLLDLGKDQYPLVRFMNSVSWDFYCGHVNFNETCAFSQVNRVVTFVRDPVEQVISHFSHFKRWYGYQKSIEDFVQARTTQNLQSKYLSSVDIRMLGLVGITEKFDESVEIFNKTFDCQFEVMHQNANDLRKEYDKDLKALIRECNQDDLILYENALELHRQRYRIFRDNQTWVHGSGQLTPAGMVRGWAYPAVGDQPVELTVLVNDQAVSDLFATEPRNHLRQFGSPRAGYTGFSQKLDVKEGDSVKVLVRSTGQVLLDLLA